MCAVQLNASGLSASGAFAALEELLRATQVVDAEYLSHNGQIKDSLATNSDEMHSLLACETPLATPNLVAMSNDRSFTPQSNIQAQKSTYTVKSAKSPLHVREVVRSDIQTV